MFSTPVPLPPISYSVATVLKLCHGKKGMHERGERAAHPQEAVAGSQYSLILAEGDGAFSE